MGDIYFNFFFITSGRVIGCGDHRQGHHFVQPSQDFGALAPMESKTQPLRGNVIKKMERTKKADKEKGIKQNKETKEKKN